MSELVIIRTETAAEIAAKNRAQLKPELGPTFVQAGSGGKICRWPDGREFGPIGGEALRGALARGAVVIGEEQIVAEHIPGKCIPDERFRPGYTQHYDPKTGELGPIEEASECTPHRSSGK